MEYFHPFYAACYLLHVAYVWCLMHVVCCLVPAACCVLWCLLHVVCCLFCAAGLMLSAACCRGQRMMGPRPRCPPSPPLLPPPPPSPPSPIRPPILWHFTCSLRFAGYQERANSSEFCEFEVIRNIRLPRPVAWRKLHPTRPRWRRLRPAALMFTTTAGPCIFTSQ